MLCLKGYSKKEVLKSVLAVCFFLFCEGGGVGGEQGTGTKRLGTDFTCKSTISCSSEPVRLWY